MSMGRDTSQSSYVRHAAYNLQSPVFTILLQIFVVVTLTLSALLHTCQNPSLRLTRRPWVLPPLASPWGIFMPLYSSFNGYIQ